MAELVDLLCVAHAFQLVALRDDDDGEVLAALMPVPELLAGVLDRHRLLRDQDHVRAARDAAHHRDPAGVAAHHLDDHHAVVGLRGGVEPVDRLGRDRDRRVEAERVVRRREVVVDRLRHSDHREAVLLVQAGRNAERVLAADRDQGVETFALEVRQHLLDPAVHLERIRPGGAQNRPAAREQAGDLTRAERLEQALDQSLPALEHADDLAAPRHHPSAGGADDRVQPRAVSAAGEDPDLHSPIVKKSGSGLRCHRAEVAELADAPDSKSGEGNLVWVQVPPSASSWYARQSEPERVLRSSRKSRARGQCPPG